MTMRLALSSRNKTPQQRPMTCASFGAPKSPPCTPHVCASVWRLWMLHGSFQRIMGYVHDVKRFARRYYGHRDWLGCAYISRQNSGENLLTQLQGLEDYPKDPYDVAMSCFCSAKSFTAPEHDLPLFLSPSQIPQPRK